MGKTLGINDDLWHGIIPFIVMVVAIPFLHLVVLFDLAMVVLCFIIMVLCLLHFFNEWKQAVDINVERKYGSFRAFQFNSLKDTRLFVFGLFGGIFVGFVVYGILYNMIN